MIATLLRPDGDTGVQTHMQTLAEHLRSQGHPVTILTPFSSRSPLLRPVFALRVPLQRLSGPLGVWWYRRGHAHYLRRALREHLASTQRPRVIYAQCPVSAEAALETRTHEHVVMVEHFNVSQADEWAEKGLIPESGRMFRSIKSFEEDVLRRLDGIVYVSDFAKALLEERVPALASMPAQTIPNFVAVSESHPGAKHERDLITVGTLEPRKNQGYLLGILAAAAAGGHRYTLTVVGDGPDRQRLERLAASLGLAGDVRFVGYQADPRTLMRMHRLYCHVATMENLPLTLLEAMAEGLPVVAAGVGGIPSLVRPGLEGEFWPLDDAQAAARILTRVLADNEKLSSMSVQARARVEEQFTADAVVPQLETFLLDLAR